MPSSIRKKRTGIGRAVWTITIDNEDLPLEKIPTALLRPMDNLAMLERFWQAQAAANPGQLERLSILRRFVEEHPAFASIVYTALVVGSDHEEARILGNFGKTFRIGATRRAHFKKRGKDLQRRQRARGEETDRLVAEAVTKLAGTPSYRTLSQRSRARLISHETGLKFGTVRTSLDRRKVSG